jgi:hypothetical protein
VTLNQCSDCGEDFSSVKLFDRHRVGVHEYTYAEGFRMDPPREDGRRCLEADEMVSKGWKRNERGRWVDPVEAKRTRAGFARSGVR